jgi:hypothetical protein
LTEKRGDILILMISCIPHLPLESILLRLEGDAVGYNSVAFGPSSAIGYHSTSLGVWTVAGASHWGSAISAKEKTIAHRMMASTLKAIRF